MVPRRGKKEVKQANYVDTEAIKAIKEKIEAVEDIPEIEEPE